MATAENKAITAPTAVQRWMVMGMYESPIKITESTIDSIYKAIIKQKDDAIFAEIQTSFGVDLDRKELIRALQYDRNQYDKGYADGKRDAEAALVRCKDCCWFNKRGYEEDNEHEEDLSLHRGFCLHWRRGTQACRFCSYGERREGE